MEKENIVIIGTGPAGLTAAIYTARAGLKPLVVEGHEPGGQLTLTTLVENFPGFIDGINGPDLMANMRAQAERFGARFKSGNVKEFEAKKGNNTLTFDGGEKVNSKTVILASGAKARWIGLSSEERLRGRGVSSCAVCDGFFFRGKEVIVVGGGDTAVEDALFLTKFATTVTLVHRRNELRASKAMQEKILNHPKMKFEWDSTIEDILGDEQVSGVKLKNVKTGSSKKLDCQGVFVAIGHVPNTQIVKGILDLDQNRYVVPKSGAKTKLEGVFVAGDVADPHYRQAIVAAGSGCIAALEAERYLINCN